MKRSILAFALMFCLTNTAWSETPTVSIETQYAPNELEHRDFFSISLAKHFTDDDSPYSWPAHVYAQLSAAGFSNTANSNNEDLRNVFVGIGAEYHSRVSPYIEAGLSADVFMLAFADLIIDDLTDTDCIERDNCLASKSHGDSYLTFGARIFVSKNFTVGAFVQHIYFDNSDTDGYTIYKVTGTNIRVLF